MSSPTMSLEEFADLEVSRALEREKNALELPQVPRKYAQLLASGEEDDEELVDQAVYEDRVWDDWKDENKKGSGNKKRF